MRVFKIFYKCFLKQNKYVFKKLKVHEKYVVVLEKITLFLHIDILSQNIVN